MCQIFLAAVINGLSIWLGNHCEDAQTGGAKQHKMYKQDHWVKAIVNIWTSDYWWGPEPGQGTARAQSLFLSSNIAEWNPFSFNSMSFGSDCTVQNHGRDVIPIPAGPQGVVPQSQQSWGWGHVMGNLASAHRTVLKQVPMLKWGVCMQDVGSDTSSWIIN